VAIKRVYYVDIIFIYGLKRKSETQSAMQKLNNNIATEATVGEANYSYVPKKHYSKGWN
jgi:hypothetical protein